MSKLILIGGVPGSGKSYFSRLLKEKKKSHVYIVSSDDLRELVNGDPTIQSGDKIVWDMYYDFPKTYSKDKDALTILDNTHAFVKFRIDSIKDTVAPLYDEKIFILFNLPREIVEMQNVNRKYPVPKEVLDYYFDNFEQITERDREFFDKIYEIKSLDEVPTLIDIL